MKVITSGFIGTEGSGIIVATGKGVDEELVGKRVSYLGHAYSLYKTIDFNRVILLDND